MSRICRLFGSLSSKRRHDPAQANGSYYAFGQMLDATRSWYRNCQKLRVVSFAGILRMLEVFEQSGTFSGMGRPSQTPGVRELVFPRLPFVAPYRVNKHQVQILRVLHQRTERGKT
jgi:hypothetical protein